MQYKTICLELLQQNPETYHQLRRTRMLLATMEQNAAALKHRHEFWMEQLIQAMPASDPNQIASEALEIAIKELQGSSPNESPQDLNTPLSLEAAMAFVRRNSPPV